MIQDRNHFPVWLTENELTGAGVEIGTYYGQFAYHILSNWPGQQLIGVDPYQNYPEDEYLDGCNLVNLKEAKECALELLKPFGDRFLLLNVPSEKAAREFTRDSLDFVYVDGNHDYKHVAQDILLWWPKIHPGGVLGGHDYMTRNDSFQRCGVEQAVNEFVASNPGLLLWKTDCSSWWLHKP